MSGENTGQRRGMHHGHGPGGPMMPGEKARDFKGTTGKLLRYMGSYRYGLIAVLIFAIGGTAFARRISLKRLPFLRTGTDYDGNIPEALLSFPQRDFHEDSQDAFPVF